MILLLDIVMIIVTIIMNYNDRINHNGLWAGPLNLYGKE